jgi:hypothetical protein
MVFGEGVNDLDSKVESYTVWHSMIRRCYSAVYHQCKPSYIGTEVCNDWKLLSNFDKWFRENAVTGWQLDKDLLSNYGKLYSEKNCTFLPNEINCAIGYSSRNDLPSGVSYIKSKGVYCAQYSRFIDGKRKGVHVLYSTDIDECFEAYKRSKERHLVELAERYKSKLSDKAYNALLKFEIKKYN